MNLPASPLVANDLLEYDEQIDFSIRQLFFNKPIVLLGMHNCRVPHLHPDWVRYMVNQSRELRKQKLLFIEVLLKAYPKLFSLPVKSKYGLPLRPDPRKLFLRKVKFRINKWRRRLFLSRSLNPLLNYIDFDEAIRERDDLKHVILENLVDLKNRKIIDWLNIDDVWNRHLERRANHSDALQVLASLEIHLKAEE